MRAALRAWWAERRRRAYERRYGRLEPFQVMDRAVAFNERVLVQEDRWVRHLMPEGLPPGEWMERWPTLTAGGWIFPPEPRPMVDTVFDHWRMAHVSLEGAWPRRLSVTGDGFGSIAPGFREGRFIGLFRGRRA
jgi:hypothetical protein